MDKGIFKDVLDVFHAIEMPYMIFTTNGFYTMYDPKWVSDMFIERCHRKFNADYNEYKPGGKRANTPCMKLQKINDLQEFLNRDLNIIKVEAFSLDSSLIPSRKELLKDIPHISYLSSFNDNVEVTDEKAQKGFILEEVIKLKGIHKDEVMVLGDGMNDISLFQSFKYSFATANGEDEIKSLAYKVVASCDEDGFKEAIDYMI